MSRLHTRRLVVVVVLCWAAVACGDDASSSGEGDVTAATGSTESTPSADTGPVETAGGATGGDDDTTPDTSEEAGFASLSGSEQHIVGGICEAVADSAEGTFSFSPDWVTAVLAGDSGVPALQEAFEPIGEVADPSSYLDAAGPICDEIGWTPDG